jgi:hypothetical protein
MALIGRTALVLSMLVIAAPALPQAPASLPEGSGPNQSITRWAEGSYLYLADEGRRQRGTERFRMHVHPDGTRTLMMWHDLFARSLQYSVMLRVADDFRPLQEFANYWTDTGYKGSVFINVNVNGDRLEAISNGPLGRIAQSLTVPQRLSIGSHPVSGDGWHTWHLASQPRGAQGTGALYALDASNDLGKPALGSLANLTVEVLGGEQIQVPAGKFDTVHYRLAGRSDVWITMPDRIVIRMTNPGRGYDYVLTDFASGDNTIGR